MGNPTPTDRRFDKPTLESLVDLLNRSNRTFIKYGEIQADQVLPLQGSASVLWNTTVRVRLAGAEEGAPYSIMTYGRLDLAEYLPEPEFFVYDGLGDAATLFEQLQALHHIRLTEDDCTVVIGQLETDGSRLITFAPKEDHLIWTGELTVVGRPQDHIGDVIVDVIYDGFTLEQLQLMQA